MSRPHFDTRRLAIMAVATAALSVGLGAALLNRSSHTSHGGPTSDSLSDAASLIGGACLGLAIGAFATALVVRSGSPLGSGVLAGAIAFLVGPVPYLWLTRASDVSAGDYVILLVVVAIPAAILVMVGAGLGEGVGRWRRAHRNQAAG